MLRFLDEIKSRQKDIHETYPDLTLVCKLAYNRKRIQH